MNVTVDLHGFEDDEAQADLARGATGADLFEALDIPQEGALLFRDGSPLPLDEELEVGETVRIVRTTSGG
jgi:sulfur carrier protein